MNYHNFEFLRNQLKYTGFGEEISINLFQKMIENSTDFILIHKPNLGEHHTEVALYFKKSEHNQFYYFNRYFVQIIGSINSESITQSFRINRKTNITLKEAYNLMNGRSIRKEMNSNEGNKYYVWLQLDFKERDEYGEFKIKQFHQSYGFDLEKILDQFPIKEMTDIQTAQSLLHSLHKGNRQIATFTHYGLEEKIYIEASPQTKSINAYNRLSIRISLEPYQTRASLVQPQIENFFENEDNPAPDKNGPNPTK